MINKEKSSNKKKLARYPNLHNARMIKGLKIGLKIYKPDQLKIVIDRARTDKNRKHHKIVYQQGAEYGTNGDCERIVTHEELFRLATQGKVEINYPVPGQKTDKKGQKRIKTNEIIVRAKLPEEEELTAEEVTKAKGAVYIHEFDDEELFPALCRYVGRAGAVGKRFVVEYANSGKNKSAAAVQAGFRSVSGRNMYNKLSKIDGFEEALKEVEEYQHAELIRRSQTSREFAVSGIKTIFNRCMVVEPVMTFDFSIKEMVQVVDEEGQGVFKFDAKGALGAIKLLGEFVPSIMQEVSVNQDTKKNLMRLVDMTPQQVQAKIEQHLTAGKRKTKRK